ncbi:MAG: LLM class oxidoreductase [Devosia sp.]
MNAPPALRHPGFARVFAPSRLTLGLMMPAAPAKDCVPHLRGQLEMASRADAFGFAALWSRDVPLFDPEFGDVGQVYDPWVWLGQLATVTCNIALSTAGIVVPLRHPLHTAKAAASVDAISGGRFIFGAASGDRAGEYPLFGLRHKERGNLFREHIATINDVTGPSAESLGAFDLLPKPPFGRLPMLAVGRAQQTVQWIARHMDGWVTYPRDVDDQRRRIDLWHTAVSTQAQGKFRGFAQSLFIDLTEDAHAPPIPIFLGYRLGRVALVDHLECLRTIGVQHVTLNLRDSVRPAPEVLDELGEEVLPHFPSHNVRPLHVDA